MLSLEIFGRSHEKFIGVNAHGFPAGEKIDISLLGEFMSRRAPKHRHEPDIPVIESGITEGYTDGKTIRIIIENVDVKSSDYDNLKYIPRPGHADYPVFVKYEGREDMRGGGKFSGRMTAPLCAAGGVAKQILSHHGIEINAYVKEIYGCSEASKFEDIMLTAKEEGDSVGGIVECHISGMPIGIGDAGQNSLESIISSYVFSVPACKGIEFGLGFESARVKGSENNDEYAIKDNSVVFLSNNSGGILGGISTGQDIIFRAAFKPTPSIARKQKSVNLKTMENTDLEIKGRHDVCIAPRAAVAVEACAALAVLSLSDFENDSKNKLRNNIDEIDREIAKLLSDRFEITDKIGTFKKNQNIRDEKREAQVIKNVSSVCDEKYIDEISSIYEEIIRKSCKRQEDALING